ncbi:MAG TPA: response regulator [Candidatus Angelobacter sp.]|nr:response regulator [Candidatus Angelobacter sp.]
MNDAGKYRVLVVDDEASVLITYRLILEQQGYAVTACRTSREAIQAVEKQDFDAVLCDYSLEEQHTGFEVITAARKRNPELPAALLTGYATLETADEAQNKNIGVMFKPIEIEEFLARTSNMLRRNDEPNQKGNRQEDAKPQGNRKGRN